MSPIKEIVLVFVIEKKILLNVSIAWSFLIMTYRLDDVKILIWLKFRTDVHNSHRQVNFCKIPVPFRIFQPNFLPLFCNSCFSVCNRLCNEIPGVTIISEQSKKGLLAKLLWTDVVKKCGPVCSLMKKPLCWSPAQYFQYVI